MVVPKAGGMVIKVAGAAIDTPLCGSICFLFVTVVIAVVPGAVGVVVGVATNMVACGSVCFCCC